jgi:hypothetical protein
MFLPFFLFAFFLFFHSFPLLHHFSSFRFNPADPNICWDPTDKYINPYQNDVLLDRCIRYDGDRCLQCYSPFSDPDCSASCANPFSEGLKAKCVPQGDRQEYLLNSNNQCVPKIVNCSKQLDTSTCEVCCQGFLLS